MLTLPLLQNSLKHLGGLLSSKMKTFIVIILAIGLMASFLEAAVAIGPDNDIGIEVRPALQAGLTMLDKHVNNVDSDWSGLKRDHPLAGKWGGWSVKSKSCNLTWQ
jgi:hypothetical protein